MLSTWLVTLDIDVSDLEFPSHLLIQAESLALAEAGVVHMGSTWWDEYLEESDGCRWAYRSGRTIWFRSITQLDDAEASMLQELKFLDAWIVTGSQASPSVRTQYDECWSEFTR